MRWKEMRLLMDKCRKKGGRSIVMKPLRWMKINIEKSVNLVKNKTLSKAQGKKASVKPYQQMRQKLAKRKAFQKEMKAQDKKPNMLKQTPSILHFMYIHHDYTS